MGSGSLNLYNIFASRPMAPFVRIFAELNRGDTHKSQFYVKISAEYHH